MASCGTGLRQAKVFQKYKVFGRFVLTFLLTLRCKCMFGCVCLGACSTRRVRDKVLIDVFFYRTVMLNTYEILRQTLIIITALLAFASTYGSYTGYTRPSESHSYAILILYLDQVIAHAEMQHQHLPATPTLANNTNTCQQHQNFPTTPATNTNTCQQHQP